MFAAPAFLLGLLAIGLPLWLHRIARENRIRQPFASLMLLEQSETQHTQHRHLRYLLLLALRIALLLAVILAFAQPFIAARLAPQVKSNARLQAIVIDASLSMQHAQRWQRARAQATELIDSFGRADRVLLVSAAGSRMQIIAGPTEPGDFGAPRAALANLVPQLARLDYGLLMSTADSWLGGRSLPVQMHLITDAQASAAPLQFAELQPPADTQLQIHDVGAADAAAENAYIAQVDLAANDSRAIAVQVSGLAPQSAREVVLSIDGREHGRRQVQAPRRQDGDAPAEAVAPVSVTFGNLELASGTHRVEAQLSPADALPQDDLRRAVIRQGNASVLLAARDVNADDVAYFAAAIGAVTRPRLSVQRSEGAALARRDLAPFSAIVVSDSGSLPPDAAARLRRHVEAGGAALVTLGPRALAAGTDPVSGLALRDGGSVPLRVSFVEDSHPTLRAAQSWRGVRFFRHLKLQAAQGDHVLVALEDGSPLLLERVLGSGRLLLLAAPLARDWNDLAIHPLFVEFISEVSRYLAAADTAAASATVGVPMTTGLTAGSGGQIFDPQGRRAVTLGAAGTGRLLPAETGFYEIRGGDQARWIAVNVDVRESRLESLSAATLTRWSALRRDPTTAASGADDSTRANSAGQPPSRSLLGRWFVAAAVLLALLEMLFANRHLAVRRELAQ